MHCAALLVLVLRIHSMVAVQLRQFIITVDVPADLAVDCRRRALQGLRDFFDGYLRLKPFGQLATFFEVQVRVEASN